MNEISLLKDLPKLAYETYEVRDRE